MAGCCDGAVVGSGTMWVMFAEARALLLRRGQGACRAHGESTSKLGGLARSTECRLDDPRKRQRCGGRDRGRAANVNGEDATK